MWKLSEERNRSPLKTEMLFLLSTLCKLGYDIDCTKNSSSRDTTTIPSPASEDVPLFLVAALPVNLMAVTLC